MGNPSLSLLLSPLSGLRKVRHRYVCPLATYTSLKRFNQLTRVADLQIQAAGNTAEGQSRQCDRVLLE